MQEFPVVKNNDLNVFKSWDNELGWCNQPNSTKIDKSDFFDNPNKKILVVQLYSTLTQRVLGYVANR